MKEVFHYFLAADTIGMSPFKWVMTVVFTAFLLSHIYISWKRGLHDIDILSFLLILTILFRSCFAIFLKSESPDQALRLLFILFPLGMSVIIHFIYTRHKNFRNEQLVLGFSAILLLVINLAIGRALIPESPHWWADSYRLKVINQIWLVGAIAYSISIIFRLPNKPKTYTRFIKVINISLIIYLTGYLLLTFSTTIEMYWVYRYNGFISDLIMVYAYSYLLWKQFRTLGQFPYEDGLDYEKINIFEIMDKVPSVKLIYYLGVNFPDCIPKKVHRLTPRQQLQAILMIHKVSIKESAEYSFISPEAVKVYRSRIRKNLK